MDDKITEAKEQALSRKDIRDRVQKRKFAAEEEQWLDEYEEDDNRYSAGKGAHKNLKRAEKHGFWPAKCHKRLQEQFAAEQEELSRFKLVSGKEASLDLMSTRATTMVGTPTARHGGALFGRHAISTGKERRELAGFLM